MAKSLSKVSEIMAICLMMIVPGLIGYVVDQQIGTRFVFTLLGLIFGMTGAVFQLIRLVASTEDSDTNSDPPDRTE
jgi:F0F1-type ATP synthase assembly protein I